MSEQEIKEACLNFIKAANEAFKQGIKIRIDSMQYEFQSDSPESIELYKEVKI